MNTDESFEEFVKKTQKRFMFKECLNPEDKNGSKFVFLFDVTLDRYDDIQREGIFSDNMDDAVVFLKKHLEITGQIFSNIEHLHTFPVIEAIYFKRDDAFVFYCDQCQRYHQHGAVEGPRVAHCHDEKSKYDETGYYLVYGGKTWKKRKSPNIINIESQHKKDFILYGEMYGVGHMSRNERRKSMMNMVNQMCVYADNNKKSPGN